MSASKGTSTTSTSSKSSPKPESPMSVPTPSHIGETEAWTANQEYGALNRFIPEQIPSNIGSQAISEFDHLTSESRVKEMERMLMSEKGTTVDANCVRNAANWSTVEKHHKFDKPDFDPFKTAEDVASRSPKLAKILQNIQRLDAEDRQKYGRKFKHFIFSDIKGPQGAKAVAAALLSNGYVMGYDVGKSGKITAKSEEDLKATGDNNFFLLSSVSVYGEPIRVAVKKDILKKFNSRPDEANKQEGNVYGGLARIIVMDSGFKEGIDLFDIKYVHIFEPQTTAADQKQVIGRGTRTCGQKGLKFNPRLGWPLYVFKYDLSIAPEYRADFRGSETAFEYYLLSKNIDVRLLRLASNLETLAIKGSVDYKLNKNIHRFSSGADSELSKGGMPTLKGGADSDNDDSDNEEIPPVHLRTAEENLLRKLSETSRPGKKYKAVKRYVDKYFGEFKWQKAQMENLCGYYGPATPKSNARDSASLAPVLERKNTVGLSAKPKQNNQRMAKTVGGDPIFPPIQAVEPSVAQAATAMMQTALGGQFGGASTLITMSPTQDFISHYFSAKNPVKGMVLWQSVGTGKTCTAIATATRQFEPLGYTILWVTRTTLKNDIWKNMFDMVCHEGVRDLMAAGVNIPDDMKDRMKLLSKSWGIRPISYKQFSNLVSKNNQYYDQLVKRNGEADPLRKTFIIIDEAHKLYGGGDLSSIERPDMTAFHKALMNSYAVSGEDSVRVMLMTATPITEDPLELMKLINLCKPADQQVATEFETFSEKYLDNAGDFTEIGKKMFLDDIAGHLSYLNREGDARQFARPILREVLVPIANSKTITDIADFDVVGSSELDEQVAKLAAATEEVKAKYNEAMRGYTKGNMGIIARVCDEYPSAIRSSCKTLAKRYANKMMKTAKERSAEWKAEIAELTADLKGLKTAKSDKLKLARMTRKERPEDYEEYQKSGYYKLKECEKQWKTTKGFDEFVESQPAFYHAKELEDTIKSELVTVDERLKSEIDAETARIRSYKQLLKTDLEPIESQVVKRSIQAAKTRLEKTKKRNAKWMKRITKRADESIKHLTKYQTAAKKQIRDHVKEYMRDQKKLAKEEDKLRNLEEDAEEDLSESFMESVNDARNAIRLELAQKVDKEEQKVLKAQQATEKKNAKLREAEEKKRAAEDKKRAAEEKKREVAEKKANKEHAAEEKKRAAEDKKRAAEDKKREAAEKKANKEHAAEEKKRAAEEKKRAATERKTNKLKPANTTRKNN